MTWISAPFASMATQSAPRGSSHAFSGSPGGARLDQTHGQMGQDRFSVAFLLDVHGRMKVEIHLQVVRDRVGLVPAFGARPAHAQPLQRHHVRVWRAMSRAIRSGASIPSVPMQRYTL
ncbi:MAG TPA: hypothetical protein VNL74_12990 [Methylococcus sp.]|nr:hypothetical protein [Methylococcus sp.]